MSSFLDDKPISLPNYRVMYKKDIPSSIYPDDTIKDVFIKLAIDSKQPITSDHIFAWVNQGSDIRPLSFHYPGKKLTKPSKQIDNSFVDKDGNKIAIQIETTIHQLIEEFGETTIYFMTLIDFMKSLQLNHKKLVTDEICKEKTGVTCNIFFNGCIRKYWPLLSDSIEFTNFMSPPLVRQRDKQRIVEQQIYDRQTEQLKHIYSLKDPLFAKTFHTKVLCLDNKQNETNIHIYRLFNDLQLKHSEIPFTKLTLENYEDTYCKVFKENISYTYTNSDKFISKEVFKRWFHSSVISIPETPVKYMDNRNSLTVKLYEGNISVSLLFYSSGVIQLLIEDIHQLNEEFLEDKIKLANSFIKQINRKKIYSESKLKLINSYNLSFNFIVSSFIYPIKDYNPKLMETILTNLPTFVHIHKTVNHLIIGVYKRVSDYESNDNKLRFITLLSKQYKKEEIIKNLALKFNIGEEEANEEYETWEYLTDKGTSTYSGEQGIQFTVDLQGTNVKVDISSVTSHKEFIRINHFMNFVMRIYHEFNEHKKDNFHLCKYKQVKQIDESVINKAEFNLIIQSDIIDTPESIPKSPKPKSPKPNIAPVAVPEPAPEPAALIASPQSKEEQLDSLLESDESELRRSQSFESSLKASSSESDSSDSSIGKLDDTDSDESTGGTLKGGSLQKGGYNVNRYYLSRLKQYDKDLFSGYSVKQRKSSKNKTGTQGYTFATKCGAVDGRQPIAVTKQELDRINATDEGVGVSFYEAVNIDGRDPDIYYMCPKYWDVKEERPRDPRRIEEFKDHIVNNKMKAAQKKNTDKYILRRDENGYWDQAGDDINRYKLELWDNFHPEGYKVPCCHAAREGADDYHKGWKVDVLINTDGKYEWKVGIVESSTATTVNVIRAGRTETFEKQNVRRHRESNYVTNSFPCNIGVYGHIHPVIKQLIHQNMKYPLPGTQNIGLVRKGVKRGTDSGDHTLLYSLQEILEDTNNSVKTLINHIISDLKQHPNINTIAKGSFVNKFKTTIDQLSEKELKGFIKFSKPSKRLDKLLSRQTTESIRINEQLNTYTAILQFEKYLKDENEIILDQYVIPVLQSISKLPNNKTFGKVFANLSIITFEGNMDDVIITPPIGGFNEMTYSLILLYKEKGHLYEPILYRLGNYHRGIIQEYTDMFSNQNEVMNDIITIIQDKLEEYNSNQEITDEYMDYYELKSTLDSLGLPCKQGVYDSYNKLTHIITKLKVMIPIKPSPITDEIPLISLLTISESTLPDYNIVLKTLQYIDANSSYKKYIPNASISVTGEKIKNKIVLFINEIILDSGHYIPIKKELYKSTIHKLPVITHISYKEVDTYIATQSEPMDSFHEYMLESDYLRTIRNLLFQKAYIFIKEKDLLSQILPIKHHPIKLRPHKCEEIFQLMNDTFMKTTLFDNRLFDIEYPDEEGDQLIIRHTPTYQNKDIYMKYIHLFIELLVIYSESDYERFIHLDINLHKIKETLPSTELLLLYSDVQNESYLDYFIKYSNYVRNISLYKEGLSRSKLIQLHKLKDKTKHHRSFMKQYPQIVKTLFGRNISFIKYELDSLSEVMILSDILTDIISDQEEMNQQKLQSILDCSQDHRLNEDDLEHLSDIFGIGFCLVTQLTTQRLEHDVHLKIHKHALIDSLEDVNILLLYQNESNLYHIQKNGFPICQVSELQSKLFRNYVNLLQ